MKTRLLTAFMFLISMCSMAQKDIYVSPNGSDSNDGTVSAPLKTLYGAQDLLRKMVSSGCDDNIVVYLAGGRYEMDETLVLSFEDVPAEGSLTFKAVEGETPVITSGKNITGWQKCEQLPEGAPISVEGKLWVADMPEGLGSFRSLFDGDGRLPRARSANFKMKGNSVVQQSDSRNVAFNKDRIYLREMPFTDQIKDWDNLSDVEVFFNPVPWNLNFIALESVDVENKKAYMAYEANAMPFSDKSKSFAFVENVVDYLDEPGEWCVNTKSRKIYYYPKSGEPSKEIYAPQLMELIRVEGKIQYDLAKDIPVKNVNFEGVTFTQGDRSVWYKNRKGWGIQHDWDTFDYGNAMLRFRGAESCVVDGCRFTNSGGSAIRMDLYAQKIAVRNSLIDYVGHMGVLLAGYGPGTKDVNKNNIIENNIIHHCGEIIWHGHGIFAWQSGENIIRHNYIHDVPRKAIGICGVRCQILMKPECNFDEASRTIRWNEIENTIDMNNEKIIERYAPYLHARNNVIEFNHVERTMLKLSDGASINVSGAGLGNIIRNNYLYDIKYVGIRTDDWQDGTTIENNIIHNAGVTALIHKGINIMRNNIVINCAKGIHFRTYPKQYFEKEGTYIGQNIFYSESDKYIPNSIWKWSYKMGVSKMGKKTIPYEYDMDHNCYFWPGAEADLKEKQDNGIEFNSVIMDPKFKNLEKKDYRITNKKMIKAIDFKPFDVSLSLFGIQDNYPQRFKQYDPTLVD